MCVDDKFSKSFKPYLVEDTVYNFISIMIEESEYCSDVMKKHFNKELIRLIKIMKTLRTQISIGSVKIIILIVMLK